MPLMCDVAYQRLKSSLHFGGFKVQAAFLGCRVGIYAHAVSGCLKQRTRACVPHTPYTLVLKFVPSAGRVYGAATRTVGRNAGYGLLR